MARNETVTNVVEIEGAKISRTTTVVEVDAPDLQTKVDALDAQIASTLDRYIKPLKVQRRKLVRQMADLDVVIPDVD